MSIWNPLVSNQQRFGCHCVVILHIWVRDPCQLDQTSEKHTSLLFCLNQVVSHNINHIIPKGTNSKKMSERSIAAYVGTDQSAQESK